MSTMNISLPEQLKRFVDSQVDGGSYGTSSEYVRTLIRKERDRETLRQLLLDGANSEPGSTADDTYFAALRQRVSEQAK